jgi:phage shock protein PspC (stress-responsive transcriptional regulator)
MAPPAALRDASGMTYQPPSGNAYPNPPHQPAGSGLFAWLRRNGYYRQPGIIGGVAAGLAWRLGWNVGVVRLVWVLLALLGFGSAIVVYVAAWLVMPDARTGRIILEGPSGTATPPHQ